MACRCFLKPGRGRRWRWLESSFSCRPSRRLQNVPQMPSCGHGAPRRGHVSRVRPALQAVASAPHMGRPVPAAVITTRSLNCEESLRGPVILDRELQCARCGYELRALPADAACPECGAEIEWSLALRPCVMGDMGGGNALPSKAGCLLAAMPPRHVLRCMRQRAAAV